MNWSFYALAAIAVVGVSDFFRKLASNLKDPFFTNLVFQTGAFTTGVILYLLFSRKVENHPKSILYGLIGGVLISTFSAISFKALSTGPGVSVVIPVLRIGGITLVIVLGMLLLKEKLTTQSIVGLLLSVAGIYLLLTNK